MTLKINKNNVQQTFLLNMHVIVSRLNDTEKRAILVQFPSNY